MYEDNAEKVEVVAGSGDQLRGACRGALAIGPLFMPVTQSIGKENNIEVTPWFHLTPDF